MMNDPYAAWLPKQEVLKVNGQNGALSIRMGSNCSALALDINDPILWVVVSDGAGYKTATPFDIFPHVQEPEPDLKTFDDRLTRMEKMLEEVLANGKSSSGGSDQRNGGNRNNQSSNPNR